MNYEQWNASDEFKLKLYIADEEASKQEHALDALLDVFEHQQGFLLPDKVLTGRRPAKYSREQARKTLTRLTQKPDWPQSLWLQRDGPPKLSVWFSWATRWVHLYITTYVNPLASLRQEDSHLERAQRLVSLVRSLCSRLPVSFGYAHSVTDLAHAPRFSAESPDDLLSPPFTCWLNVLGRDCVEALGRERVLALPAHHLESLADGSVLFLTRPSMRDFDSPEARLAQARALCHLRPELSLEDTLSSLLQRSLVFQPLEPSFHPDVAPLLYLRIGKAQLEERRGLMERFNAFVPPPVSERLPSFDAPPADVEDPLAAIRLYEGFHAERLTALLHKDLPEVMAQTPDTLAAVDEYAEQHHWAATMPEVFEQDCVPMLGAHLGLLLVRHLGGRWVPRQRLDEVQVIVGATAWLPFLRARHLLEARRTSGDAFLRFSLTQLFLTAAREAGASH
ncbi:hypothetical protein [Archangium sp.]|uniref:hypothetical protein n=1 Tax=Archangium sp. TaxID=1872627 RepID=UPI002D4B077D|nr:hypothetical protein [Archangium sp.]HYO51844.1 hypothetical protein [Archangium sp.]